MDELLDDLKIKETEKNRATLKEKILARVSFYKKLVASL
jgi:hypothetical protein